MKSILLPPLILLCCFSLHAQQSFVNNGNLKIFSGASVSSFGDFTNKSASSFTNDGSFYVKGNLTNDQSSVLVGSGTLYLDGTNAQSINGLQKFSTYHLQTNNPAGITLNNDLSVSGVHTFSAGVITTASTPAYLVYESGASYSGATDVAHVNGWIKKLGSTDFIFPTGNTTYLREVEVKNLSASSELDAQYNGVLPPSYLVLQSPLSHVNPNEYWTINRITGGTAQITLNWNTAKAPFPAYPLPDIRAAWFSGSGFWINEGGSATGNSATSGSITSDPVSNFGRFAIASTSSIVPLKFLGISANREHNSVKIIWQTANEVGVNFHEVQKSADGFNFTTIGKVAARNSDFQAYDFIDWNAGPTKLFYRIKENDFDGSVKYSKIATVSATGQSEYIELIENPVRSVIKLVAHAGTSSVYFYQLINSSGQVCKQGSFESNGTSQTSIPLSIQPGEYTLIISNAKHRQQFKLIVL